MRRSWAALSSLLLFLACEARDPEVGRPAPGAAAPSNPLLGGWTATSVDFNGLPQQGDPGIRLTFTEDEVLWLVETSQGPDVLSGAYRLDLATDPPHIDIADPFDGDPSKLKAGLFRVDGDVLTIALGNHRPASFEQGVMASMTLRREARGGR